MLTVAIDQQQQLDTHNISVVNLHIAIMLYSHKRYDISTYVYIYIYIYDLYIRLNNWAYFSYTSIPNLLSSTIFDNHAYISENLESERAPELCLPCYNLGLEGPIHTEAHSTCVVYIYIIYHLQFVLWKGYTIFLLRY